MKNNFLSKNKKILFVFSPLFLVSIIIYLFFFHLNILVSLGFRFFTYGTLNAERVVIEEGSDIHSGTIELDNSKMFYNRELVADTPRIIIKYNNFKIDEINIYDSKVKFVRNGSDTNFVEIFTGPSEKTEDENSSKKKEDKNSKSDPILNRINVYGAELNYVDRSYSEEISQIAYKVDGYVQFNKDYNVNLEFSGTNGDEKYFYSFNNLEKSYDMQIKATNIKANNKLVQYGYDSEGDISDAKGIVNLDLRINDDGFFGEGELLDGEVLYNDLGVPVKDINLDLKFLGEKITIDGDYVFLGNKGKFNVDYQSEKGVNVNFDFKNIPYKDLANYKYLKQGNLEFDDLVFDDVNILLSMEKDFKVTIDFESNKGFTKDKLNLSQMSGEFIYENGEIKVQDFYADLKVADQGDLIERQLFGDLFYKDDKGKINVRLKSKEEEFLSDIDLSLFLKIKKDEFHFKLDSSILDLKGKYNIKKSRIYINQKNNFELEYNLKDKKLEVLKGYIESKLDDYKVKTEIKYENNNRIDIDSSIKSGIKSIEKKNKIVEKVIGKISGNIYMDSLAYRFNVDVKDIDVSYKDMQCSGNINGYLKGEKNSLKGEFSVDNISFAMEKNKLKVDNILGNIYLEKMDDLSLVFQGEVGNIRYDNYEISGFRTSVKYADNNIKVLNASNKFLTLNANYSIIKSKLNLFIKGFNLNKDIIKVDGFDYNIDEIDGHIFGDISDIKGNFIVKNGSINIVEKRELLFDGRLSYWKGKIYSDNFHINKNELSFSYDIDKKIGNYSVDIFEDTLSAYIPGIKFKIVGKSSGIIKDTRVEGKFDGKIEDNYYKGQEIPNISVHCDYNNEEIVFKDISLLSLIDNERIVKIVGSINIKDKLLDFSIPKQTVLLEKFIDYEDILGNFVLDGNLKGTFDQFEYNVTGTDGLVSYNRILADNIGFNLSGDNKQVKLSNFSIDYEGNNIISSGEYNIENGKYDVKINSKDMDFKFLLAFLSPYGIDDINGIGDISLHLTDIVPEGNIKFDNLSLKSKKYGVDLKSFYGNINLEKGFLKIDEFSGILNDGSLNLKGYMEIRRSIDSFLEDNLEGANYSFLLDGRNINYSFEDYFNLNFNTRLSLKNNKIYGNFLINEGEVNKILNKDFGIIKIVKDFLKDFFNKNKINNMMIETNKSLKENTEEKESDFKVNVGFRIDKGIELHIDKATGFVTDIRGTLFGQGSLRGTLGKINFLGENDIKDGEFILNGNKFTVDRAIVLFNNRDEYIPDVNPNINFSTSSVIDNKNVEFTLDGPLKHLTFTVRNGNKVSVNSLDSILGNEGMKQDENSELSILLVNLIGGQITDIVLNPVVQFLRHMGLKDFRLKSSITTEEKKKNNEFEDSSMIFGAYVEAESPLYKDKVFWRIKANFTGDSKDYSDKSNRREYGIVDYDVNLYHKLNKNVSWGVGVQKLKEDLEAKGNHDVNYYIELKFEKRFNFRNGGLE